MHYTRTLSIGSRSMATLAYRIGARELERWCPTYRRTARFNSLNAVLLSVLLSAA
jgi:hypothetical protein